MNRGPLDPELLQSVATQLMSHAQVDLPGQKVRTGKTTRQGFETARVLMSRWEYEAIEQNPEKPSPWENLPPRDTA